ncbi:hypothetical protein MW887_009941 [Aspergillus wentii]|nr:hypothetical protein MW887_009941 [Aspergillus wentii]
MSSIHPEGVFDSLAKFYVSAAIIWTVALLAGCVFLCMNRHQHCIRIRNLPLALSAVACLHVYWILCMVAYSMGNAYPCVAEYWIMSIYLPLGIALFQANSMQLLNVFGIQEKLLLNARQPSGSHLTARSKSPSQYVLQWKQMNLVQRTEVGIAIGMVIQVIVSLTIFLTSRKFHNFGTFSHSTSPDECRTGPEWIPSILWQLCWSWIFAPWMLWKIRNIHDIHHWRLQITCCVIAGLPGSPMWLAALYLSTDTWKVIGRYWVPALWFAPGIMAMEAVTVFFPCYELVVSKKQRNSMIEEIQGWAERKAAASNDTASGTALSSQSGLGRMDPLYSRRALDKCLAEDSRALLHFAASKEFSGENILFLNYVRDWKAAWITMNASQLHYDWKGDLQSHRLHFFNIAVEIFAACVDLRLAEFPINIESRIYADLTNIFGEAAFYLGQHVSKGGRAPTYKNLPKTYNQTPLHKKMNSTVVMVDDEDTEALCLDKYPSDSDGQSIMHIEPRVPGFISIPAEFDIHSFDEAEKSIKTLVFTNTWPKFIESESSGDLSSNPP